MLKRTTAILFLACLGGMSPSTWAQNTLELPGGLPFRVGWVTRVWNPPHVDGQMTSADGWEMATALTDFTLKDDTAAAPQSKGWLLYDDEALYVAVQVSGPGRGDLKMRVTERDGNVNQDDSVHLFIVPPDAPPLKLEPQPGRWYFHLTVNPLGTQRDAIGYKGKSWWNGDWTARTSIQEDGWTVEMRIPFSTLGIKGVTQKAWGFNLCRGFSSVGLPKGEARHYFANWSPKKHWYSFPDKYGRLLFGAGAPSHDEIALRFVQRDLASRLESCSVGLMRIRSDLLAISSTIPGHDFLADQRDRLQIELTSYANALQNMIPSQAAEYWDGLGKKNDALLTRILATQRAAQAIRMAEEFPADWPFVVLGGPPITDTRFERGQPFPSAFKAIDRLQITACRGEYEPATFVLYALENRDAVKIKASDLMGADDQIPASAVNLHVIKYWYQAGEWGKPDGMGTSQEIGVLVPELLLKNDGLVVVDHEQKRNFVRTEEGLIDITNPAREFNAKGRPLVPNPSLMHFSPRDTPDLQAFDVHKDQIKQIFITVHVPVDTKAGIYRGDIEVHVPASGSLILPLTVEVLPFDLVQAPIDYSIYTRGYMVDGDPNVPCIADDKTEAQYRIEMAGLFAHGIINPMVSDVSFEKFVRAMQIRQEVGMPKGHIYHQGIRIPRDELDNEDSFRRFKQKIPRFVKWAQDNGYKDYYLYGIDEADPLLPQQRRWMQAAHEAGAKVFVSVEDDAGFFDVAGDILDLPIMSGPVQPDIAKRVQANGHRLGIYAFPQVNWDKPEIYRRNYGMRLWQAGYDVEMTYAYQHSFGHIWNDFDYPGCKDFNLAYPTVGGVIDTLIFEGLREAVDDTRYVATLLIAAENAMNDPARQAKAKEAEQWVRTVDPSGDLNDLRRQVIDYILQLIDR